MVRTRDQISGLCKKVLQGTVPGKRKRGRQKKRWEDNIKEWTGLDFNSSQIAAEDRQRWKKIVADVRSGAPTTLMVPVSRFECVSGLSVYPVEIRSVNNLSSSEDCSTDYCQPV